MKKDERKLQLWRDRLSMGEAAYANAHDDFVDMDRLYTGNYKTVDPVVQGDTVKETPIIRNIVREIIEAQISTAIPMPKVTARRKEDEHLAELIEDMLRDGLQGRFAGCSRSCDHADKIAVSQGRDRVECALSHILDPPPARHDLEARCRVADHRLACRQGRKIIC